VLLMAALRPLAGAGSARTGSGDAPMFALYLWTYFSSILAHAVFLGLPASAAWGAAGMAVAAVPLAWTLGRERRARRAPRDPREHRPRRPADADA
jgi:hypothetical protein